jgi:hypothetical protein
MHRTTDIAILNWSVMTFSQSGINNRNSKKTRRDNKRIQSALPTIHEDAELLLPAMISAGAPSASRKDISTARASSYETKLTHSEIVALFKQRRIAAKQIRESKQGPSESTTICV